jgi:DNA-binding response OmpR family regulator
MTSGAGEITRTGAQRVLIVDDEPLLGDALGRLLIRSGYDTLVAFTAEHAEFVASGQTFDCAIIDVELGEDDGIELACRLLRAERIKKVVFYSGLLEDETLRRALGVGACVEKAARFEELAWAVEAAVDGEATR